MRVFIILISLLCILSVAYGQPQASRESKTLRIIVPAENDFGNEDIERVSFLLYEDKTSFVWVHPKIDDTISLDREFAKGNAWVSFFFDLGFEADSLVFAKKFPGVQMPVLPSLEVYDNYLRERVDSLYRISWIDFYQDSTKYQFSPYSPQKNSETLRKGGFGYGKPARYLGNMQEVAADIAREVGSSSIQVPFDSVLVFQSTVRRFDMLLEEEEIFELEGLVYGVRSVFSEIVSKHFQSEENRFFEDGGTKWRPAHGDRSRNTRVKIYVRLERDGSVTIKLPRYVGNWTGD